MARRWRLQTARFRDQRAAERALWDATGTVFDAFCRYVWAHCGMPGEWAGLASPPAAEPYSWLPGEQAEFDRAVQWFMDSMVGKARDPEAFADPSTALIDVHNPIYDGKPILPGQLRTSYELGVNRAVQVVGDNAPRLLGPRNAEAQREFLTLAFRRLSDGARLKLGDVLNGTPKTGQSVRDMLLSAMNEGQGALKTARQLRTRFREIDGYDWQRLARTETSFAMNAGTQAEYLERGYRIPATETGAMIELGPFHPCCVCGTTVMPELGYIVPDVAATACQVCQAARIRAEMVVAQRVGVERIEITPVPAPQPRVSRRPVPRDTGAPTEPVNVGPVD